MSRVLTLVVATSVLGLMIFDRSALADTAPSNAQLLQMLNALQARVATLEEESRRYQQEAEAARFVTAPVQRGPMMLSAVKPSPNSLGTDALAYAVAAPTWSGIYWGVSFGAAGTQSDVKSSEVYTAENPSNSPANRIRGSTYDNQSSGDDDGAALDAFLGVNRQMGRMLAGVQLEGTLAEVGFNSEGTRSQTDFNAFGPRAFPSAP